MDIMKIVNFILENPGLIIGVVLLLLGALVLPSTLRKYVLTAGLAIVAFRVFQIAFSGKRLAKADAERARLQEEMKKHAADRDALIKKQDKLNNQAIKIKLDLSQLDAQSRALDTSAATAVAAKMKLDMEAQEMRARHEKLLQASQENEKTLSLFNQAEEAIRVLERIGGTPEPPPLSP